MDIIYKQKQNSSFNVYFPFIILLLFCSFVFFKHPFHVNFLSIVFLSVLIILFITTQAFFYLTFEVKKEDMKFGFGIFKCLIKKSDIKSISIENSRDYFMAQGITIGKNKMTGYIARHGEGVVIETKHNKTFFVSLNEPEKVLQILIKNKYV